MQANNFIDDPVSGKGPKVVIYTVGFHGREGEETLQSIAKTYGGTYRFVPGPVGEKKPMKRKAFGRRSGPSEASE